MYFKEHLKLICQQGQRVFDMFKRHQRAFLNWFRAKVLEMCDRENLSQDFFSHAMRPLLENSGVMVVDEEVEDIENEQLNVLKIIVAHLVDEHIEVNTFYRTEVDPTMVERSDVHHVADDFIDDDDGQLSSPQS
ncbi:uncharacterized protein E6C27_scaffold2741G00120 [Cucumis melo var. makuwa]|uniref:Uncharacterized protein n=1 Tax=Cucumis melo var. makuwa TaxID=1194695 RepID=A0A5A7TS92_CUCMM|nr:uncharacterized protein E6C27_scaffold2741G00120 [Cucumis melo var. makuwa]